MRLAPKYIAMAAASLTMALTTASASAVTIDFELVFPLQTGQSATWGSPNMIGSTEVLQISNGFNFQWNGFGFPPPGNLIHGHIANNGLIDLPANPNLDVFLLPIQDVGPHYLVTDDSLNAGNALTISDSVLDTNGNPTPFSIQSFEVASAFSQAQTATSVQVTGNVTAADGGGTLTSTILLNAPVTEGAPDTTTFIPVTLVDLDANWSVFTFDNVVFEGLGTGLNYFAIDDIVVNEPVVEEPGDQDDRDGGDKGNGNGAVGVPEPSSLALFGFATLALGWAARRRRAIG